jgi:cytochrome c-type protein NapB
MVRITLIIVGVVLLINIIAAILLMSGNDNQAKITSIENDDGITDNSLGFVNSNVHNSDENLLSEMPQYSMTPPGAAEKIDRAFENAPPMIPHMTTGFFPITKDNNICLSCHMPDKVASTRAVAIPESHFTNYRPEIIRSGGKYKVNSEEGEVFAKNLGNILHQARFNCSQCHVPQANVTVDIRNTFEAVFRDSLARSKSNLDDNIREGVK